MSQSSIYIKFLTHSVFLFGFLNIASAQELVPANTLPKRLPEEQLTIDLYKRTRDAVVYITTRTVEGDTLDVNKIAGSSQSGAGAGVIIDKNRRIILTNLHVISDATDMQIMLSNGKNYPARLVGNDPEYDLAVLQLISAPKELTDIPLGNSKALEVGQRVFAIGNPHGLERTLTSGIVSSLGRTIRSPSNYLMRDLIQTDAAINPGNSGGPLLDLDGRLVGINSAIVSQSGDSAGISFAVPVHKITRILPELIATGKVLRPRIGWLLMDSNVGPIVRRVLPKSPAEMAGLVPLERAVGDVFTGGFVRNFDEADVIISVQNRRVNFIDEVEKYVSRQDGRKQISVVVRSGGDPKKERVVTIKPVLQ